MSTPTNSADASCGELSCDECNERTAALMAERDQLRARAERAEAELDALSKVKALLFDALEHYQNCVIAGGKNPARDAIAAALKEGAK